MNSITLTNNGKTITLPFGQGNALIGTGKTTTGYFIGVSYSDIKYPIGDLPTPMTGPKSTPPEVMLHFTKVESIDAVISALKEIKEKFTGETK